MCHALGVAEVIHCPFLSSLFLGSPAALFGSMGETNHVSGLGKATDLPPDCFLGEKTHSTHLEWDQLLLFLASSSSDVFSLSSNLHHGDYSSDRVYYSNLYREKLDANIDV